jgi:hypothetical protein
MSTTVEGLVEMLVHEPHQWRIQQLHPRDHLRRRPLEQVNAATVGNVEAGTTSPTSCTLLAPLGDPRVFWGRIPQW